MCFSRLLKLGCELKFISPWRNLCQHLEDILIMILRMNVLKKINSCWKNTRVAITLLQIPIIGLSALILSIYCAPLTFAGFSFALLIFAQIDNLYIGAPIIFAHWWNLHFRVALSHVWKCSTRYCVKYAEIRDFCNPYLPIYGQNRIRIFP